MSNRVEGNKRKKEEGGKRAATSMQKGEAGGALH